MSEVISRGEIWLVQFDPTVGHEIRKTRPAVVLSNRRVGHLELSFVCPLTDWKDRYHKSPWFLQIEPDPVNGLEKSSGADALQCKSLSKKRFVRKVGSLGSQMIEDIIDRLLFCLTAEV